MSKNTQRVAWAVITTVMLAVTACRGTGTPTPKHQAPPTLGARIETLLIRNLAALPIVLALLATVMRTPGRIG